MRKAKHMRDKAIANAVAYLIKNPEATAYRVAKETHVTPYLARKLIAERQTPVDVLKKPKWKRVVGPGEADAVDKLVLTYDEQDIRDAKAALDALEEYEATKNTPPGARMLAEAVDTFAERGKTYGSAAPHWREVAIMWSAIAGTVITADTAVKMMIALKLLRLKETPNHHDSIVDIAGYAAVLADIVEGQD